MVAQWRIAIRTIKPLADLDGFLGPFLRNHRSATVTVSSSESRGIWLLRVAVDGLETTVAGRKADLLQGNEERLGEILRLIQYRFAEAARQAEATRHV
jgi:hypothetical protein